MAKKTKIAIVNEAATVGDEPKADNTAHARALRRWEKRQTQTHWPLEARLAGDLYCMKNVKLPSDLMSLVEPVRLQFCDFMFPYAVGGPLFIDRAVSESDEKMLNAKAAKLMGSKVRYVVIPRNADEKSLLLEVERLNHGMDNGD